MYLHCIFALVCWKIFSSNISIVPELLGITIGYMTWTRITVYTKAQVFFAFFKVIFNPSGRFKYHLYLVVLKFRLFVFGISSYPLLMVNKNWYLNVWVCYLRYHICSKLLIASVEDVIQHLLVRFPEGMISISIQFG